MALSDKSTPHIRAPTHLIKSESVSRSTFHANLQDLFEGKWVLIKSSNPFWTDKRNVRMQYTTTGTQIDDQAFYQTKGSDAIKSMDGKDTPSETEIGIFTWQGKGLMRIVSARWEVLSYTSRPESGDWMIVYAHKSIFTAPALNLMCRERGGVSSLDMDYINEWFGRIEDESFQQTVAKMVDIVQE